MTYFGPSLAPVEAQQDVQHLSGAEHPPELKHTHTNQFIINIQR
jgi:hypothetical protein